MKTIYLKFWTLLLVAPTFFPACTEEYGPMSDLVATPGISLPEQATEFLNHLYPNDEYTDLQYLPNAITSEGMYYIAYEDGRTVYFDDAGELLEITFPDGEVPVRLQALANTIQGITQFYDSAVIGAMRTAYGVAYELEDGRRVAAYEEGKLGFEQLNLHEGPTADELLPPTIFAFANAHFPEKRHRIRKTELTENGHDKCRVFPPVIRNSLRFVGIITFSVSGGKQLFAHPVHMFNDYCFRSTAGGCDCCRQSRSASANHGDINLSHFLPFPVSFQFVFSIAHFNTPRKNNQSSISSNSSPKRHTAPAHRKNTIRFRFWREPCHPALWYGYLFQNKELHRH